MTVLFAHNTADLYGASRSLLRLSARLREDGHAVLAVVPDNGPLCAELERAGVEVVVLPSLASVTRAGFGWAGLLRLLWRLPLSVVRITALIRRRGVDLVHTNTALILSSPIAARLCGRPHVWHIREFFAEFPALWKIHRRIMCHLSDVVIAVSAAVGGQFGEPDGSGRVRVIHNGFPRQEFEGIGQDRVNRFRTAFGLNGGPTAGVVGRIKLRRKGQEVFIQAAAQLAERLPEARFLLIGSPFPGNEEHLAELERMVSEYGLERRVTCTGDVADIKAAFAALDITVLPGTLPEPFGGVVVESMAMGKPVIGTRVGGTVEQIEDGVTGILVEPNDPQGLAAAMETLLTDARLRSEMGTQAKARFLKLFEFEPFYLRMSKLYAELVRSESRDADECQESSWQI